MLMKNVYLITSNSYHLMEDEVNKIVGNNPFSTFDLNIATINDVIEEASYVSLFDEERYIVVRNSSIFGATKTRKSIEDLLSKDESDLTEEEKEKLEKFNNKDKVLLDYLEQPNSNTILIFTLYGKADSKKKITRFIKDRYEYITIDDFDIKKLHDYVTKNMKQDGYKIDCDTVSYILESCQNNFDLVYNELEKIKLYYGKGCNVLYDDVTNIVTRNIEDNNFKFIDVVMSKNLVQSYKIYDDLMIQKVEPIMLLSMLAKEVRNTLLINTLKKDHSIDEIMSKLKINHKFQVEKIIRRGSLYNKKELEDYLLYLCDLDYKIKRGKVGKKLALEMFILYLCK